MSLQVEKARAIAGAIYWEELDWLATQAQSAKVAIELGSWAGKSSRAIADNLPKDGILYCVDTWAGSQAEMDNPDHPEGQVARLMEGDYVFDDFCRNMWDLIQLKKVKPIRMHGKHAATLFANQGLQADFIFIDAGHGKGEVKADIESYFPLLRTGGLICGHDYKGPGGLHPDIGLEVDERFGRNIFVPPNTMIWAHNK